MTTTAAKLADDGFDVAILLAEIDRYLRVVDAYRREGCEPHWLPETTLSARP